MNIISWTSKFSVNKFLEYFKKLKMINYYDRSSIIIDKNNVINDAVFPNILVISIN